MKTPRKSPEVTSSSGRKSTSGCPRSQFLGVLLLLYALVLQISLGGVVEGTRAASLASLPAQTMLCQPGKTVDGPAGPMQDHGQHDGTCCLAACATRLVGGPLPSAGEPLAYLPLVAVLRPGHNLGVARAAGPILCPLSARGPPLAA
jgi:hypothetical protein